MSIDNDPQEGRSAPRVIGTSRLEAFSDGVFAIAITLLVLELAAPAHAEGQLGAALLSLWPSYLAYVVSFATVGALWIGHTVITHHLRRASLTMFKLNLLLLLIVSFLPFPTGLLAENLASTQDERVAASLYGATLLAAAATLSLIWRYALRDAGLRADLSAQDAAFLTRRLTPSLAAYAAMLVLGLVAPQAAVLGYFLIALLLLAPARGAAR
jgi:uncharacterized membrane protein